MGHAPIDLTRAVTSLTDRAPEVLPTASVPFDTPDAVERLAAALPGEGLSLVLLYCTARADAAAVIERATRCFAPAPVIGCTTAGEITQAGYADEEIVAIGLPSAYFAAECTLIPDLDTFDTQSLIDGMIQTRNTLTGRAPDWGHEFNMLLIDGMSTREDALVSSIAVGLGPVPLFGGSAGDGVDFGRTHVFFGGQAHENAAVLTQIRTRCPIRVFKTDHLAPTERRMVVTGADPTRRVVHEINAEPAAREFARVLGKDPEQLDTFTFAAHPVVVRIGGEHHVRSIQRVSEDGELVFFSAIDEGLVLTLAEARHMVDHLSEELAALSRDTAPAAILACDCILRRMEAQEKQMTGPISDLLRQHRVVGFSTYGEQYNSMHVNQTLTGVAIYPPGDAPPPASGDRPAT